MSTLLVLLLGAAMGAMAKPLLWDKYLRPLLLKKGWLKS